MYIQSLIHSGSIRTLVESGYVYQHKEFFQIFHRLFLKVAEMTPLDHASRAFLRAFKEIPTQKIHENKVTIHMRLY
jgi:hypothetical protein